MPSQTWNTVELQTDSGQTVRAKAPVIISASRSTDIPAFFSRWFMNQKARVIVFWSKNPEPLIRHLPELDANGINYYFQFTVNDYARENLEPHLPSLSRRIDTFRALSEAVGKQRVVWRFDPLVLTDRLTVDRLQPGQRSRQLPRFHPRTHGRRGSAPSASQPGMGPENSRLRGRHRP